MRYNFDREGSKPLKIFVAFFTNSPLVLFFPILIIDKLRIETFVDSVVTVLWTAINMFMFTTEILTRTFGGVDKELITAFATSSASSSLKSTMAVVGSYIFSAAALSS